MSAEIFSLRPNVDPLKSRQKTEPQSKPRIARRRYKGSPEWQRWQRRSDQFRRVFSERLKHARAQLGITEEEAAAAFSVTLTTYRKYKAGQRYRSNTEGIFDFCDIYDVSLTWLPTGAGSPPPFRLRAV
jgi:hypothetical protein